MAIAASALVLVAMPSAASATDGSYQVTAWSQPAIYNVGYYSQGALISPPAGVPSNATITSITGSFTWSYHTGTGQRYLQQLCIGQYLDPCTNFGPLDYSLNSYSWTRSQDTVFAGRPAATTSFRVTATLTGGTTGAAINPPRTLNSKSLTVNYSY